VSSVAWYDIRARGWLRDILILLHLPYTLWHLSYIPIGAALAPEMDWRALGWTVLAFFLAMGIGAHCLDELNGRPLKTTIPSAVLWLLAGSAIAGAVAIGVTLGVAETVWVIPCIIFGGFIVFAYNMELFGGRFHTDLWFGVAWGGFPAVTAYIAQTHTVSWEIGVVALAFTLYSMAQRALSTQSRFWRRRVTMLEGLYSTAARPWGRVVPSKQMTKDDIIRPVDVALKFMNAAVVALAVGMLLK